MIPRVELKHYRLVKGEWGDDDIETLIKTFQGRISMSTTVGYEAGKQTSTITPTLMCEYDLEFTSGDIIENTDGQRYTTTDTHQPNGVAGVHPRTFKARQVITLDKRNG